MFIDRCALIRCTTPHQHHQQDCPSQRDDDRAHHTKARGEKSKHVFCYLQRADDNQECAGCGKAKADARRIQFPTLTVGPDRHGRDRAEQRDDKNGKRIHTVVDSNRYAASSESFSAQNNSISGRSRVGERRVGRPSAPPAGSVGRCRAPEWVASDVPAYTASVMPPPLCADRAQAGTTSVANDPLSASV